MSNEEQQGRTEDQTYRDQRFSSTTLGVDERICSQCRPFWRHVGDENSKTGWMIAPAALHDLPT
jgi:hypothetical protein